MSWITEAHEFKEEQKLAISNARSAQTNITKLITNSLSHQFERGILVSRTSQRLLTSPTDKNTEKLLSELLESGQGSNKIALYDTNGKLSHMIGPGAGSSFPAKLDLSVFTGTNQNLTLFAQTENDKSILLFRPASSPEHTQGFMLASIDFNKVLEQFKNIAIGKSGVIYLYTIDGVRMTRLYNGKVDSHKTEAPPVTLQNLNAHKMQGNAVFSQNGRVISYERIGQSPFIVMVSQDKQEILQNSDSRHNRYIIAIWIVAFVTSLSLLWMLRVTKHRHQLYKKLLDSERDKNSLISALVGEKEKAYALATQDHLTQLPNRQLFMELAVSHLARAKRSRHHYAAMFINVDRFKPINDSLGHHVGDLLLKGIAERLTNCLRESDIISRFGSDEFVVMLAGVGTVENISKVAEKIIHSIELPFENLAGNEIQISCSIGIAIYPRDGIDADLLIKTADDTMHKAKQAGQGRYAFFDQNRHTNSDLSFELDQRFYKAIQNNELVLHYQAKVSSADFSVVGVEALVRWQHPQHGLIFPGDFVPVLESSDKIVDLGDWVINEACRQVSVWKSNNQKVVPIAINISTKQLLDMEFAARLLQNLKKYSLEPKDIELEVTESCFMNDTEISVATLNAIAALGVKLSLDDFGTGFSSLGYIKALPLSEIKIDRSFIRDIRNDQSDKVIVSSTITLAHNLGLTVVAEGVETFDQLMYLKTAGCDVVQGYYFSRPVSADLIKQIIDTGSMVPAKWDYEQSLSTNQSLLIFDD
ncbi:MAG: EAL domain-containing protein [Methylotenera sp.]|nr:EAL domain-containing protein [Methylotenera sp.]